MRRYSLGVADPSGVLFPDPHQVRTDRRTGMVLGWIINNWPYLLGGSLAVGGVAYVAYRAKKD